MLTIEELAALKDTIMEVFPDRITEILSRANRSGKLDELLSLLGIEMPFGNERGFETYREGKIVVVGGTEIKEEVLKSIGKQMGLGKERFEFCLDYKALQKYDFKKMQYAPQYRVILFGPILHSGSGKGDSRSIISEIEKGDGYPRTVRLISGQELKITKSSFRDALQLLKDEQFI